jgi:hypothetical protein
MRKLVVLFFILLSSFIYAQEQRFSRYELFCDDVFESDSNRWVISKKVVGCYGFFMNESQNMIMMLSYNDSTETFYNVLESKNEFMHWTNKTVNIATKEIVYFHYFRSEPDEYNIDYYNILRLEFADYSLRFKVKQY